MLIQGLQNFKKLRQEGRIQFFEHQRRRTESRGDAVEPDHRRAARGIHIIVTCDTYNNVSRYLGRKTLSEFEMRVVFQMSASDSASLIDNPSASTLGLNRALFYNDREGSLETFRPYAQPDGEWIENVARSPAFG